MAAWLLPVLGMVASLAGTGISMYGQQQAAGQTRKGAMVNAELQQRGTDLAIDMERKRMKFAEQVANQALARIEPYRGQGLRALGDVVETAKGGTRLDAYSGQTIGNTLAKGSQLAADTGGSIPTDRLSNLVAGQRESSYARQLARSKIGLGMASEVGDEAFRTYGNQVTGAAMSSGAAAAQGAMSIGNIMAQSRYAGDQMRLGQMTSAAGSVGPALSMGYLAATNRRDNPDRWATNKESQVYL